LADAQKLVVVVGRHVVVVALHIVAWCVVANDKMLGDPFSVHVGVPVMSVVEFVPASVIVIVQGAAADNETVEDVKFRAAGIVAPATVSLPTVYVAGGDAAQPPPLEVSPSKITPVA
jgi:hypothetical protein